MYHSITFGEKNTWDDWHLVPSSRPVFSPPEQKLMQIDIPGGDGILDMSESLTGYPIYNNRKGSIEFIVMLGDNYGDWSTRYSDIMDYLHGRTRRAVLEDDKEFFYEGRFTVSDWTSNNDGTGSRITIDYDIAPYKMRLASSLETWEWDPFNFETGVIQSSFFNSIVIDSDDWVEYDFTKLIGRMPVVPKFHVTVESGETIDAQLYVKDLGINWRERHIPTGTHVYYDFVMIELNEPVVNSSTQQPTVKMKFKGHGVMSIEFRSGGL